MEQRRVENLPNLAMGEPQDFAWLMDEFNGNIYISDLETYELKYLNRAACATLGKSLAELTGRKCYEIIQGLDAPCPFCTNRLLCGTSWYEWEYENPVLKRRFMIKDRVINWEGRACRIELSYDMHSAEYKLAQKDREREAIMRSIPGGFARVDARDLSRIIWYDANFLGLIGYTKAQFEQELHSSCGYIHPEDLARVTKLVERTQATHADIITEVRVITHDGERRLLTMTLSYVSGEDSWDGIPSYYSIGIDITETRAEQERQRKALEDAYQALRAANSAKTDFLSSMSHDIRTPMNAIVGMTAIAQANLSNMERVSDCLSKINISSRHLLSLINEVLDMSKIESGKIDLISEQIDLSELIQGVTDICRPLLAEKGQEFSVVIGRLRHEAVMADGERLKQVFMNLLSNAIKYSPEGGEIMLTINELPSLSPEKGWYEFVFKDNGIGMSSDFIPHIFEPFTRAEDSRISKIQGTGLGMAITENIVQMMNGSIKVQSELGVGSEFTVTLPLEFCKEGAGACGELTGLPVLVVDDDQAVCEVAAQMLAELGMRGEWVLSGEEGVRRMVDARRRADDFFAVILDWKMPGMDGLELVKAIRRELGPHVPIIVISAYDFSDIEEEFIRAGADAFITKPLFKSKMLRVLQLFCGSNRTEGGDAAEERPSRLPGKRVLLAEDNELNREIAVELLKMQGLLVDAAEDGVQAVNLFRASPPGGYAAILMDIQMPVLDGYGAATAIRALPRGDAKTVPILALTANAFASDIGKAQSVGMNGHIPKPIDVERLAAALEEWIGE